MNTTNIVPDSSTRLAYTDCVYVEANISRGVTSGSSSPSSLLMNINCNSQQHFQPVAFFGFYASQATLYPKSFSKLPSSCLQFVAKFPSTDCFL